MAFSDTGSSSHHQHQHHHNQNNHPYFQATQDGPFEIFEWYPKHQSCICYFLDHAQYSGPVQIMASFINIQLPFQQTSSPVYASSSSPPIGSSSAASARSAGKLPFVGNGGGVQTHVSLIPYIRRLVVTGFDVPAVLHSFFGDDWADGIGPLRTTERRNYMFAAKSDTWLRVKHAYDMQDGQTVPFLRPLQDVSDIEIQGAESNWSDWLAMQDWMLGPRAPQQGVVIKREQD